ncbi:hypothetical protein D3C80_1701790 [compost metagenome]
MLTHPALFVSPIDLIAARLRGWRGCADQYTVMATVIFTRVLLGRIHPLQRHRYTNVTQIQCRIEFVHHMVVIGEAQAAGIWAKDMHVGATTQRAWGIGGGNVQCV